MTKGHASRGLSVFLRLGELACGAIVLGIIGRLLDLADEGGSDPNGRLIYAVVISSLTIIFSLFFILPMAYSFWSFPIDLFMFAAWLVVFVLLETLTGTDSCNSGWYNTYWGYYWGRWYRVAPVGVNVNWSGCSAWRTALAFSFVAMFTYLISFCLGLYWIIAHGKAKERSGQVKEKSRKVLRRRHRGDAANEAEKGAVENQPSTGTAQAAADEANGANRDPFGGPLAHQGDSGLFGTSPNTQTVNPLGSSPPEVAAPSAGARSEGLVPAGTVGHVDKPTA